MTSNTSFPVLVQMVLSLGWRNFLLLHDGPFGDISASMDATNITYLDYDIASSTDEHLQTILNEVEDIVQPVLHLLLLCDPCLAVRVLQQMECFDAHLNSSFDMRHSSRVIMMGSWEDVVSVQLNDSQVENVVLIIVTSFQDTCRMPTVWTLLFSPDGRVFSPVALSSWSRVKTLTIFPNVLYGYNGRTLTVVMKRYVRPHGSIIVNGLSVYVPDYRILQYLAQHLNFSCKIMPPREDEFGRNIEGNWTGIIGMIQRKVRLLKCKCKDLRKLEEFLTSFLSTQEADISESLTIHRKREVVMDFVFPPIMENPLVILYKMEEADDDTIMVYLRPFTLDLYTALAMSLLVYTILLCLERWIQMKSPGKVCRTSESQQRNNQIASTTKLFASAFWDNYKAALRQGSSTEVSRDSERLLVACWWIFTVIISTVYCGTILASLTVRKQKPPFSNLAELAERLDYRIGYDSSSIEWVYIQMSNNSDFVKVRNRIKEIANIDPDVSTSELTKHFRKIQEGKYAFLGGIATHEYMVRRNCKWTIINTKLETRYLSFTVPKMSPFKKDFENSMYQLQDNGILQKVKEDWLRSIPEDKCPMEELPRSISLRQLHGILIAVGVGICVSALILCGEKILVIRKRRN